MVTHSPRFAAVLLAICCSLTGAAQPSVRLGADVFVEKRLDLVRDKRVGLITNQTGRLSSGEFLLDVLRAKNINVVRLFGPEHGVRGRAAAGEKVGDSTDAKTGIPVVSLYGKNNKPTPEMLHDIDVLVYDIQDVGARFYTYISTMILAMEAAAEKGIDYVVLDRPNPLGGMLIDGPVLDDSLKSFVGIVPIPIVYGLTCGELARVVNERGWYGSQGSRLHARLTVIPMEGWKRTMRWDATGLPWTSPSPNISTFASTIVYPATCFLEATNVSEGRGTDHPFQVLGAPFIDAGTFSTALNSLMIPGVRFVPADFTPSSSKYSGKECHGVSLEVIDQQAFRPGLTGLSIIQKLQQLYPTSFKLKRESFLRLFGSTKGYEMLIHSEAVAAIVSSWQPNLERFKSDISRHLLY